MNSDQVFQAYISAALRHGVDPSVIGEFSGTSREIVLLWSVGENLPEAKRYERIQAFAWQETKKAAPNRSQLKPIVWV